MKNWFFGFLISSQVFAGSTTSLGNSQSKEIFTDNVQCDGDIFCVDHMRETCNSRKESINSVFDLAASFDPDLQRNDLIVVAAIRKNGRDDGGDSQNIKRVECKIAVNSLNQSYQFNDSISEKFQHIGDCQAKMEQNLKDKRVLFQEIQEVRSLFVRKACRVYLLELIIK